MTFSADTKLEKKKKFQFDLLPKSLQTSVLLLSSSPNIGTLVQVPLTICSYSNYLLLFGCPNKPIGDL